MNVTGIVSATGVCLLFFNAVASVAQENSPQSAIVVYGDPTQAWFERVAEFAQLIDPEYRPEIIRGDSSFSISENDSLVWFGDLTFDSAEVAILPEELEFAVHRMVAEIGDQPRDNSAGIVTLGVNCFTSHMDREDGLPKVAVNLSGEDPQDVCKGYTIAHLLISHQRWLQGEGTF
jgi:hypothetical protein